MEKYYLIWCYGSCREVKVFEKDQLNAVLECVREHKESFDYIPVVYYGTLLEFEPAEIIKSWKVKKPK